MHAMAELLQTPPGPNRLVRAETGISARIRLGSAIVQEETCAVCLEAIEKDHVARQLHCKHVPRRGTSQNGHYTTYGVAGPYSKSLARLEREIYIYI